MKTCIIILSALLVLALLAYPTALGARTWYILPDGTGDAPTIQAGIDSASNGDVVELADGMYMGQGNYEIDFLGKAITVRSHFGNPDQVIIDCWGVPSHRGLFFQSGEGPGTVLEGVTIRRAETWGRGGGIRCDGGSPTIRNCIIEDCYADLGGAICCENGASPSITDCVVRNNSGYCAGGISCTTGSSPLLTRCLISGNAPTYNWGGGLRAESGSHPRLIECIFTGNYARSGSAICSGESSVTAEYCLFYDNSCYYSIVYNWQSNDEYIGCTFVANYAVHQYFPAHVVALRPSDFTTLRRSLIAFNQLIPGYHFICTACDLFGNEHGDWIGPLADQLEVRGNFSADPCFCDLEGDDFHLCADSWCLPARNPWGWEVQVGALGEGCGACECGGPVPTEFMTWGGVKSMYW